MAWKFFMRRKDFSWSLAKDWSQKRHHFLELVPTQLPQEFLLWKPGRCLPWVKWMSTKIKRCQRGTAYPKWLSLCQGTYWQGHSDQKSKFPELQPRITSLKSYCLKCLQSSQWDLPWGNTIKVGHTSSLPVLTVSFQCISFSKDQCDQLPLLIV